MVVASKQPSGLSDWAHGEIEKEREGGVVSVMRGVVEAVEVATEEVAEGLSVAVVVVVADVDVASRDGEALSRSL